jgi:xanthine dehydrogenase YagS FAD-binding subunit
MKQFYYVSPQSFADAVAYLDQHPGKSRVIGGGTDLVGELRGRVIENNTVPPLQPDVVIDLGSIPNADYITESSGVLKIGALAKIHDIETSSSVQKDYPLLAQAAQVTATYQIRVAGTIGGNICQDVRCWYYRNQLFFCLRKGGPTCYSVGGDNSMMHSIYGGREGCYATNQSDMACALMALDANIVTTQNTIPIKSFFMDMGPGNVLKPDEIVTEIDVPQIAANTAQSYTKWEGRRIHGFGIIKVAAALTMSGTTCTTAKIALGGVANTPMRATAAETALAGKTVNAANAAAAATAAVASTVPMTMNKYKVFVTQTLISRAILAALPSS